MALCGVSQNSSLLISHLVLRPPGSIKRSSNLDDKWDECQYFRKEKTRQTTDIKNNNKKDAAVMRPTAKISHVGYLVALESKKTKCFCRKHQLSDLTMERESMFCSKVSVPCEQTGYSIPDAATYGDPAETFFLRLHSGCY